MRDDLVNAGKPTTARPSLILCSINNERMKPAQFRCDRALERMRLAYEQAVAQGGRIGG